MLLELPLALHVLMQLKVQTTKPDSQAKLTQSNVLAHMLHVQCVAEKWLP